jgi:hypothetical protein
MTAKEAHVYIDLQLQEIGSYIYDYFKPQEVDTFINQQILRFISERTNVRNSKQTGFEINKERLSDIKDLIKTKTLPLFVEDSESRFAVLPNDFLAPVEVKFQIVTDCGKTINITTQDKKLYYSPVDFTKSKFAHANPFSLFRLQRILTTTTTFLDINQEISNGIISANPFKSTEEIFTVINKTIETVNDNPALNLEAFYERYLDLYIPNRMIFVSLDSIYEDKEIGIRYSNTVDDSFSFTEKVLQKDVIPENLPEFTVQGRIVVQEELRDLINHPFGKSTERSPLCVVQNQKLITFFNKRFLLKSATLTYIRKPQKHNIILGKSFEMLDERVQQKILDNTATQMAAVIQGQNYQVLERQTLKNE